jgi:hypothetical protein
MYRRYAIYVTPQGALAQAGAQWLGWDIARGQTVEQPAVTGFDLARLTKRPRRYGLHATVKPPMILREGTTIEGLLEATAQTANKLAPVYSDSLTVTRLGSFLALTNTGDTTALTAMAQAVVAQLDPFRAPPSTEELARRRKRPLTASQEANLTRWGYPHVMEDYRFHITLTGPHPNIQDVMPQVAAYFTSVLPKPFIIDHLTVAGEDHDGMFHALARLPLGRAG